MSAPGWFSDENLRKQAREHFAARPPLADIVLTADGPGLGLFLHSMLAPPAEPGPPYTHTLAPPPEPWYSRTGKLVYRPPAPRGFTMSGPGVGHGTPPPHSAPDVSFAVGDDLGPPDEFRWTPDEDEPCP